MKQGQLAASIKVFQAKSHQLQRSPAFPVQSLRLSGFMRDLSILSHNKPIQNIWMSAPETFLLKKQVPFVDPTNAQKRRGQRKHYHSKGHSSPNPSLLLLSSPTPSPANNDASKQIRISDVSHLINLYLT